MLSVTPAEPADVHAVAELLEEMDRFYGTTEFAPIEDRIAEIMANVFANDTRINLLLARDNDQVVGLASYSFLWPAVGLTKSIYLKELYVRASHRRHGVGTSLIDALVAIMKDTGCSRLEWTTDEANLEAQAFYAQLDLATLPTKVFYRLEGGKA